MSDRFTFRETNLADALVVQRHPRKDQRGYLERLFAPESFSFSSIGLSIKQINHTLTHRAGTVRGLHFQFPPQAETKLVTCLRGEIFDVAVDLRKGSETFMQWHGEILSATNFTSFLIPEGFAHGFQALSDDCEILYLNSAVYDPAVEGGVSPIDPRFGITWPLKITELSARDASHQLLDSRYEGITL